MTAVSSVAAVVTVPLYLSLGADHFGAADISDEISMPGIAARVFLITVVPLSIGMLIRARRTAWALAHMDTARKGPCRRSWWWSSAPSPPSSKP